MHTHTAHMHTNMHMHILTTYFNIRLTGVQDDDSEDGHDKEKSNNGKDNSECNHSWEEVSWSLVSLKLVSTFWRPCGVGFNANDKHESI